MKAIRINEIISLDLSKEEALVLFDWVSRFNEEEHILEDQSEERIFFDLEAILEANITEVLDGNYSSLLQKAREKVRN